MTKIHLIASLLALILMTGLVQAETSQMEIHLSKDPADPASISIQVHDIKDPTSIKQIISDPTIKAIYQRQLEEVFSNVHNLDLKMKGGSFTMEFDTALVKRDDEKFVLDKIGFNDNLSPPDQLTIVLSPGYEIIEAQPAPDQNKPGEYTWLDPKGIPQISFKKSITIEPTVGEEEVRSFSGLKYAIVIVVFFMGVLGLFLWRRRLS